MRVGHLLDVGAGEVVSTHEAEQLANLVEREAKLPATPDDLGSIAQALFQLARKDSKLKVIPFLEREMVIHALKETRGNQVQAAKILGITRATLRKRVEKFGITQQLEIK